MVVKTVSNRPGPLETTDSVTRSWSRRSAQGGRRLFWACPPSSHTDDMYRRCDLIPPIRPWSRLRTHFSHAQDLLSPSSSLRMRHCSYQLRSAYDQVPNRPRSTKKKTSKSQ